MHILIEFVPGTKHKAEEINVNFETLLSYCKELEQRIQFLENNKCD